ncbi:hypothetical protein N7470_008489 [Penicillium chermesinum]|nr:hypothetical protein N7470_008489 [Penicillium chermesinum]
MTNEKSPATVDMGESVVYVDEEAERSYRAKVDLWVLPVLCLMYFFDCMDRSNLANAKTDGLDDDLNFKGNDYSLLILLFYIPFGLCDLPWNLLIRRYSGRVMLSSILASAFSGLVSFGVFQIDSSTVKGWQWLFIIEGGMTFIVGIVGFFILPHTAQSAWFLNDREKEAAKARMLRDSSSEVDTGFNLKECFRSWNNWQFPVWCVITFTYPVAYATSMNFFPLIVGRLGFSTVKTNLWTVAPNLVGALVLLCVAKSSDFCRERTFHIIFSLTISLVGMVILAAIDVLDHKAIAYFACFLMAAGSYIPSCLVHAWHNNNEVHENARAANSGLFVGLGNLAGILSAATFRTQYAPKYIPTLVATCCCNVVCIIFVAGLGSWMRMENHRRDRAQGLRLREHQVDTSQFKDRQSSPDWRYFL